MVDAPRFTILMPTHYRPDVIGYAIQSVLDQTEPDFELLVAGDGAVSGTAEAVLAFNDPRIRWFDFPKAPGFGYDNRNRAMREARGEIIAFMSDDDLYFRDHLEKLGAAFEDPAIQFAYSRALHVSRSGRARPSLVNLEYADELKAHRKNGGIAGAAVCYRAGAPGTADPWPNVPRAGDFFLWLSIIDRHSPACIRFIREPTVLHFTAGRKYDSPTGALARRKMPDDAWRPAVLTPTLPPGSLEQAAYAAAMRADPEGWTRRARDATTDILVRQSEKLRQANGRMRRSMSWRITAPLRALSRLMRRPGGARRKP